MMLVVSHRGRRRWPSTPEATVLNKVRPWLDGKQIRKRLYVPNRLVNFVVS